VSNIGRLVRRRRRHVAEATTKEGTVRTTTALSIAIVVSLLAVLAATPLATGAVPVDTEDLREAVTVDGVRSHQAAFQAVADANGGTRLAGTSGYDDSAQYVYDTLVATGYFNVEIQPFTFTGYRPLGPSTLEQTAPDAVIYTEDADYNLMSQTNPGDVTGLVTGVDLALGDPSTSTSGCEASDFAEFPAGDIALIQRGTCTFELKAENAEAAGAIGVIIFNQGNTDDRKGLINGTLSDGYSLTGPPVFEATFDRGVEWASTPGLELHMIADVEREPVETSNVIAETMTGRDDRVVVAGAHLDSVPQGPGIQDNGSGSAAILEIAVQMAELEIEPRNQVRFAWWGAEESGLVGSQFYVDNLSKREIKNIALNLNFDMIGSPNFVRFVYDGNGSDTGVPGPNGSGNIEQVFLDYFADQGLANEPTVMGSRSDHAAFVAAGIPAGGLFTGAEGIKTEAQAEVYGGTAGDQYDPCYHLACDTFANISLTALDQNSDAAAHAVLTFAETTSAVNGTDKANDKATHSDDFLGSQAQK
jgi:Zn-dependent M28 family amino/carboxypeptidase